MTMLRQFSLRQVIIGTMAALALVAFSAVVILIATASSSRAALELQSDRLLADRGTADAVANHVQRQLSAAHNYMDDGDTAHLATFTEAGMAAYDELRVYLLRELGPEERRLVERIRERHETIEVEAQRVFASRGTPGMQRDLPGADALRADLGALIEMRRIQSARLIDQQRTTWRWIYIACATLGIAFAIVLIIGVGFLRRRLLEPLGALSAAVHRVGAGDFEARVSIAGNDELAAVGESFNTMTARLRAARDEEERSEQRLRELLEGLRESEERYHSLFDRVPVGLYRSRPDGKLLDGNLALVNLLGFDSREDLLAANAAAQYVDPEERRRWSAMLDNAAGVVEIDLHHRRQDGAMIWLRDTARAVRDADGRTMYYEGALQDVTERVRAEEAVRRSEARFRSLIENAHDGVLILSRDGGIIYQSPAIERLLGYPAALAGNVRPFDLIHHDDQPHVRSAFAALDTGNAHAVEFRCRHADGGWRVLHATGTNLLDDPFVGGYVINISDTTTHRQLEEQLQHAQKMEAVGRLAGGIAHDFNNLLTAIQGYTDLLGDRALMDDRSRGDLLEIRRAVDRAARLTRQLLAFSRRQVVRPRATEVGAVVAEVEHMLRRLITEDIPLRTSIEPDCWVNIDPGQLEQVVVNLVVNARDAVPVRGIDVVVRAAHVDGNVASGTAGLAPGEYVEITVTDDGTGIEPDVVPFIFEPFFTTKDVGRGTGLGLSTVYGIVQESGGRVVVDTAVGRGTSMRVFIPRVGVPAAAPAAVAGAPTSRSGTEIILLVEDEPAVRSLAERVLKRHGYHVIAAENGVDALDRLARTGTAIDLLVTDVVMPAMGGVQLATRLLDERPDLRVLFMSGYAADTLPARDAAGRPLHFLEKPFSPATFAAAVRTVLDESLQRA